MKNYISAIITPTFNNEDYTIRCFDSIRKNTKDYKIIWIDNGSKPESREKVKKFLDENNVPYELIQNQDNLGFVKATNQGMKRAMEFEADYIVLQNNDTEVYDGWLERMIEVAKSDPKIGLVGPITSPCRSWQSIGNVSRKFSEIKNIPTYDNNPEEYSKIIKEKYRGITKNVLPSLAFFCTLIKSEVVKNIGFLSEDYGIGFLDDDDYCTRAISAGWKIILALDVFVFHNHRTTFKSQFSENDINKMLANNFLVFEGKYSGNKNYDFKKIKNSFSSRIGKEKSKKNKIAIYTAIFGYKDDLIDSNDDIEGCDFICFTDNVFLKSSKFELRFVKPKFSDPTRDARMYKTLSHRFLPEYEYVVWIDSNVKLKTKEITKLTEEFLKEYDQAMFKHPERDCVYQEKDACIKLKKEKAETLEKQAEFYRKEGYPRNNGLVMTTVIFRRNNSSEVIKMNEDWWKEIEKYSKRDQMSFNYVAWKNNFKYKIINENAFGNRFYERIPHKIKKSISSVSELIKIKDEELEILKKIILYQDEQMRKISEDKIFWLFWLAIKYKLKFIIREKRMMKKKASKILKTKGINFFVSCVFKYVLYGKNYFNSREYRNYYNSH